LADAINDGFKALNKLAQASVSGLDKETKERLSNVETQIVFINHTLLAILKAVQVKKKKGKARRDSKRKKHLQKKDLLRLPSSLESEDSIVESLNSKDKGKE
jgi:hypothetical protein